MKKSNDAAVECAIVPPAENDSVNHPAHYASGDIECIDAIEVAVAGVDSFLGMCVGNAMKYEWRFMRKAKPIEDLKKAVFYLNRAISFLEEKGITVLEEKGAASVNR